MEFCRGELCPERREQNTCVGLNSLLSLLEKIPAVVWATDLEFRLTALTGAGMRGLRMAPDECAGKPIGALLPSRHQKPLEAHRLAAQGQGCSFHAAIGEREMDAHVEPLLGADGNVAGVIGVALDGSGRAVAERALRLSEQSYRLLIEEAPYAICRATPGGKLLHANRAMLEMLGYEQAWEGELLQRDMWRIFRSPGAFEELRERLGNGCTVRGLDATWVGRTGNPIEVRIGGRALRDPRGRIVCLDILSEDISERKRLEARLSQAHKMQAVGQLAGGVAHDFNNLLTVISGQIEMVLGQSLEGEVRQRLEDVRQAAERAGAMTRQLLAFSRGKVLESRILDVNPLIAHLTGMLNRLIRENIELEFVPGSNLGLVRADPSQIEQVLLNLVVNAQDAMAEGGRLTIETSAVEIEGAAAAAVGAESAAGKGSLEPGQYVLISVCDTGHGMDAETQARIFEPFFTTKKTGEGTGLGLATVHGVVRQSGGHIRVESQLGVGTTFRVYLPQAEGEAAAPAEAVEMVTPEGSETILLAEDERWVRKLVAAHLTDLGYSVLAAADGAEALEMARAHREGIDLLLSDLVMPRVDGRELARELRKTMPGIKVIFVSGYAGHLAEGEELNALGANFLPKPFTMQLLARTVREVLQA
jgi:two-component system, cell cycle sensor histidine kinase and response regulator CckA